MRWAGLAFLAILLMPSLALAAEGDVDTSKGYLVAYLLAFAAGFGVTLTPCVYPLIPITIGVFGGRDEDVTRRKALVLATFYVLGMATLYTSLGVGFALAGKATRFGTFLANPWVTIPLASFFAALAASMFGFFELALPNSLQNKLNGVGGKGYGGAFGMGLVSGLIAAPCTGPVLIGILTFTSTTGSPVVGGSMLFVFALGMGVPFWLLAAFMVSLPKSGAWMETVKSVAGVGLLAVAAYIISFIAPPLRFAQSGYGFLAATLGIAVVGLAIGGVTRSFFAGPVNALRKGVGVLLIVAGVLGTVNWFLTADLEVVWRKDEKVAFADAKAESKGVMIDFWANWCLPCKELEAKTFSDEEVNRRIAEGYVPLKLDVSEDTEKNEALMERYGADTLPTIIFLDANGNELSRLRGKFMPPGDFLKLMDKADAAKSAGAHRPGPTTATAN